MGIQFHSIEFGALCLNLKEVSKLKISSSFTSQVLLVQHLEMAYFSDFRFQAF